MRDGTGDPEPAIGGIAGRGGTIRGAGVRWPAPT